MSPLSQSLAVLAQQRKLAGSLASLVRAEMPAIEAARKAGLNYAQICQGFAALGVQTSPRTLRHTVYRIQAEQDRNTHVPESLPQTSVQAVPPAQSAGLSIAPTDSSAPMAQATSQVPVAPELACPVPETRLLPVTPPDAPKRPGPSPGFVRDIINSPIDIDELARQYRTRVAARRVAASSAQAPPAASTSQGSLPL